MVAKAEVTGRQRVFENRERKVISHTKEQEQKARTRVQCVLSGGGKKAPETPNWAAEWG